MDESQQSGYRKEKYKKLGDEVTNIKNNIGTLLPSEACRELHRIIQACDDIHKAADITEKLENTTEVVLDAHIFKSTTECISKLLLATSEFSDTMYKNAICAFITNNECDNWQNITNIAIGISRSVPTKSSMLGAIDIEPQQRAVNKRQQNRRSAVTTETQPETVKQLKRNDRGAEKVNIMYKQLNDIFASNGGEPIPFYRLVIDPNNFMNTVENVFQMAFLARDGNIAIEKGSDGHPQVRLVSKEELRLKEDTSQAICTLNMGLCEKMVKFYKIKEAMLHQADDLDERTSGNTVCDDSD